MKRVAAIRLAILLAALASEPFASARDSFDVLTLREQYLDELPGMFENYTQSPPTDANLIRSLGINNAKGRDSLGQSVAIMIFGLRRTGDPSIRARILELYRTTPGPSHSLQGLELLENRSSSHIRREALVALYRLDPVQNEPLVRSVLDDRTVDLEYRAHIARTLAAVDDYLYGYVLMGEVHSQNTPTYRLLAKVLVETFKPHEGKVWNQRGDKVSTRNYEALKVAP